MPRQLRIEFSGAFYHVYSRGNQKLPIYLNDEDRYDFLKVLGDAHERLGAIVHLYCLLDNHYHLGLETPEPNLSRIMHFINSVYLNLKHERCGHVFQGRFKAILVQADAYARTLAMYIHGNPVRNGMVEHPEQYAWSSCQEYYAIRKPPAWLGTRMIMGCFHNSLKALRDGHESYLRAAGEPALDHELKNASRTGILGDAEFVDRKRRVHLKDRLARPDGELRELRRLRTRPELAQIRIEVGREFGANTRLARRCMILIAHSRADYKLKEIGSYFGLSPAAVSVAFKRTRDEMISNSTLCRAVNEIVARLFSSAEK